MDVKLKEKFISLWKKYFNNAELSIAKQILSSTQYYIK